MTRFLKIHHNKLLNEYELWQSRGEMSMGGVSLN